MVEGVVEGGRGCIRGCVGVLEVVLTVCGCIRGCMNSVCMCVYV